MLIRRPLAGSAEVRVIGAPLRLFPAFHVAVNNMVDVFTMRTAEEAERRYLRATRLLLQREALWSAVAQLPLSPHFVLAASRHAVPVPADAPSPAQGNAKR